VPTGHITYFTGAEGLEVHIWATFPDDRAPLALTRRIIMGSRRAEFILVGTTASNARCAVVSRTLSD
jgi:hypothetical protein